MGRRLVLVICLLGLFALPGRAGAATIPLAHCGQTQGLECGTVDVPLDRTGATPGTIGLHVEMLPGGAFARGTIFLIAGGPGQGSASVFDLGTPDNADFWQALFPGYTIVTFDNRGTGKSGVISCPGLQGATEGSAEQFAALARDCAVSIGDTRQFYATRDHAEDIESVRVALGLGQVGLYGVSYGTKLALAYALAHPSSVDRLVLVSVVPPDLPDPFERNVLQQMPATLQAFCAGGVCNGATKDFAGEFVQLANQLEAKPIAATILTAGGSKVQHMNGEDLVTLAEDSDLNPGLAAELPAAVHAALKGQVRPLLRLHYLDLLTEITPTDELSFGLNAATNCADGQFPWSPDTPVAGRQSAIDSAVAALPDSAFGPFGRWAARLGLAYFCEQWPSPAGRTPLGPGPLPNVPVLILSGGYDMRTPTASAQQVAAEFPQSHLVVVPGVGHDPVDADLTYCAAKAVRDWSQGGSVPASCPRVPNWVKVLGAFQNTRVKRSAATTLAVAGKAIREAEATWVTMIFSPPTSAPGIYGGREVIGSGLTFSLKAYSDTPGIALTGKLITAPGSLPFGFNGTVRISGSAAVPGTLHLKRGKLTGRLGGRRVSAKI